MDDTGESLLQSFSKPATNMFAPKLAVENFLKQTTSYMDSVSWVERYAWFAYAVRSDLSLCMSSTSYSHSERLRV